MPDIAQTGRQLGFRSLDCGNTNNGSSWAAYCLHIHVYRSLEDCALQSDSETP